MKDPQSLRETLWRRPLTPTEEAELRRWLESHPVEREDFEIEEALSAGLNQLPEAPVSSNFTSRVLQAVERETGESRGGKGSSWWHRLLPKMAYGLAGVLTFIASYQLFQHQEQVHARQLAESMAVVSGVAMVPSPDALQDFEAIRLLNDTPAPDEQLLALFQ